VFAEIAGYVSWESKRVVRGFFEGEGALEHW